MNHDQVPILALIVALACIPYASADDNVVIAAKESEIDVTPRAAKRRLVNLPALTFGLRAAIKCDGVAMSLTLSIADTATTLGQSDLDDQRSAEALLTVPARQVALATSKDFCIRGDSSTGDELVVPGLATAHASLSCRNGDSDSIHYASAPLQVRLRCIREVVAPQEPSVVK